MSRFYLNPKAVVGYFLLLAAVVVGTGYMLSNKSKPPQQPIAFSHKIHASKVGLACNFCHIYADKSVRAGIPSVQKCMSCHSVIATDKKEIKKIRKYWDEKKPIQWVKVHSLPKFVYFSHKRHIKASVTCFDCHGKVQASDVIRRVSSLRMGWCVRCHRLRGAPTDCLTCHK